MDIQNEDSSNAYSINNLLNGSTSMTPTKGLPILNNTVSFSKKSVWSQPDVIQRVISLLIIMIMTIIGNTLVLIVLTCSKYRKINSRVNIFIINLAVGDLTVCVVTMTTEIIFVAFDGWILGPAACKMMLYAQIITLASTTFILTSMSLDRYFAICKPLSLTNGNSRARKMIIISWIMAFIFAIPQIFIFVQTDEILEDGRVKHRCVSRGYTSFWQRKVYFTFLASYILIIPAIAISFCYINIVRVVWKQGKYMTHSASNDSDQMRKCYYDNRAIPRARIKTIKMTLSIIVIYITCWMPYFVTHLVRIYSQYDIKPPKTWMAFVETIAVLQSALNPILYGFFNIKMRRGLRDVFCVRRPQRQNSYLDYNLPNLPEQQNGCTDPMCQTLPSKSVGYLDYISLSDDGKGGTKRITMRYREPCRMCNHHNTAGRRIRSKIIAERNQNGFRLRVRFLGNDDSSQNDLSSDGRSHSSCGASKRDYVQAATTI